MRYPASKTLEEQPQLPCPAPACCPTSCPPIVTFVSTSPEGPDSLAPLEAPWRRCRDEGLAARSCVKVNCASCRRRAVVRLASCTPTGMVLPTHNILVVGHSSKSLNGLARVDGGAGISVGTSCRWTIGDRRRWEILGETGVWIIRIGGGNSGRRTFRSHTHRRRNGPDSDVGKRRTGNRGHRQFLIIRCCNAGCRIGSNDF